MKGNYKFFLLIVSIFILGILFKLYLENNNLKTKIIETENKYEELRINKNNVNFTKATLNEMSFIQDTFNWIYFESADGITLENYSGKTINLKEKSSLNNIILESLENNIIMPINFINNKMHNEYRFYYILRYKFNDTVNEIIIFDNGTIKYQNVYYESPYLLSLAQSLMPITDEVSKDVNDALDMMLNASIATYDFNKISDIDKSNSEQSIFELIDNAVRLRASAYFINNNMVETNESIVEKSDMMVHKSTGYCEGNQVDMYIFTINGGEVDYVKLIYNNIEEVYKLKSELRTEQKYLYFNNIWTAD